jgi:hypothetical protein
MSIFALGRLFDVGTGWAPVDLNTADGATGKRISMAGASGITFLVECGVGGSEDLVLDVQQHTAYTGGTSNDLDSTAVSTSTGITRWYIKAETALDNDEGWVKITQAEASECTVVGATYGTQQKKIIIEVDADQLGDTYTHLSLNAACSTSTAQLSSCSYILHGLRYPRTPTKLWNLLNPGAANA